MHIKFRRFVVFQLGSEVSIFAVWNVHRAYAMKFPISRLYVL